MHLLYAHTHIYVPITQPHQWDRHKPIFIHEPLSCTSLTSPTDLGLNYLNCFNGLKPFKLCSFETISSKSAVLHISYLQMGEKHNPALKETLLGLTDISLETILFEWKFIHTFLKSVSLCKYTYT